MNLQFTIKIFKDPSTIKKFRHLRWEVFRKRSNLPLGSEYYEGEERGVYFGAFIGSELVGGALLIDRENHNGQMHHIVVREENRENGIGTLIMFILEQAARKQGINTIYIHARKFLRDFYGKRGYILVNKKSEVPPNFSTQRQPGVPHVFMYKPLRNF